MWVAGSRAEFLFAERCDRSTFEKHFFQKDGFKKMAVGDLPLESRRRLLATLECTERSLDKIL